MKKNRNPILNCGFLAPIAAASPDLQKQGFFQPQFLFIGNTADSGISS